MTRWTKLWLAVTVPVLSGALLLAGPSEVVGGVTITKCKMADKTNGIEVTSGMADSDLSVEFRGAAKCTCSGATLTYTWYFGDTTSADGATVSHVYGDGGAGNRSPSLSATCNICKSFTQQGGLSVAAIRGITVTQIGDIMNPTTNGRLCFDGYRTVSAVAEPSGVSGSDKIDWYLVVTASALSKANMASGDLGALPQWPMSNSLWGANTLYVSIDGPHVAGQEGEMILTGTASYVSEDKSIKVFYDGTGTQNPDGANVPNWFYYYKDNAGGGAYGYASTGRSTSTAGGGMSSVRIGNEAYAGDQYMTFDYGNPGGRLRATGWSGTNYYYANFLGVLAHETQHATNETAGGAGDGDADGDFLRSAFETGTSLTDPANPNSASASYDDGEVYAGGPVEKGGIDGANTSADWAHAGTNWP